MRTVAEGRLSKLILFVIAVVAVFTVATWYPQFAQGYEVENQGKLACNEAIKAAHWGPESARDFSAMFIQGCNQAEVHLQPSQFSFDVTHNRADRVWKCEVHVRYPVDAEIWAVGSILALQPIHFVKKIHFTHEVPDSY